MPAIPRPLTVAAAATTAAAALALSLPAAAEPSQTITRDLSQPVAASAVSNDGAPYRLAGSLVTVRYSDGSTAQALFTTQGSGTLSSAVAMVADAFVVDAQAGNDTSRPGEWNVTNLSTTRTLVGFTIDGRGLGQGQVGFDVSSFTTTASTPGSNDGVELLMNFSGRSFIAGSVQIAYSLPVALTGQPAAGDLFARVDVSLAYTTAGLGGGLTPTTQFSGVFSSQRFGSDVDAVVYSPVPEPATAGLFALGLGAVAVRRRRPSGR